MEVHYRLALPMASPVLALEPPVSLEVCSEPGLDYVSCAPYRLPMERLAAAQVAVPKMEAEGIHYGIRVDDTRNPKPAGVTEW